MISIKQMIYEGKQFFDLREYYNAYNTFKSAINLFPSSEEASTVEGKYVYSDLLRWKGITEIKLGMLDEAIHTFNSLLQKLGKNPPEVIYYLSLARYYYSYFLIDRTLTLLSALNDLRIIYPSVNIEKDKFATLMALIYSELNQLDEAERIVRGISLVGNIALAHIHRKRGLLSDAESEIDELLKYEKDNVDALIEKALILKEKGEHTRSLALLDCALKIEPTNVLSLLYKAEILESLGNFNNALLIYKNLDTILYSPLVKSKLIKTQKTLSTSKLIKAQTSSSSTTASISYYKKVFSRPLSSTSLKSWDPKVWVGKKLSIYKIDEILGEGGNGYVLKAVTPNGVEVAIKVLKIYSGVAEEYFENLINEASNLSSLSKHPNIVEIYAVNVDKFVLEEIMSGNLSFYEKDPPRIVMEFMKGGSLDELLKDDIFFYSSKWNKTVYKAISIVAKALNQMHIVGFIHMDVKPQNIFLTQKPKDPSELDNVNFKLGDLGSALRVGNKITQLTVEYAPPEAFIDTAKPYIDTFSLGMTTYVLLTRKLDRPDLQEMNDAFNCLQKGDLNCVKSKVKLAQEKLRTWDPNVPSEVKPLLKAMMDPYPLKRPASLDVYKALSKLL